MVTCDYNGDNIIVSVECLTDATGSFDGSLAEILEALTWCDTYNIDTYWQNYGNFMGYLTLYNYNRDKVYILTSDDVIKAMQGESFTLASMEVDNDTRAIIDNMEY